ncbi:hypothetical protein [Flavobacterium sp.]|uniref:hypothetical protein n=1 Tax=Flavobacterium sp. TaxID=239 RepID=UPI0039E6DAA2
MHSNIGTQPLAAQIYANKWFDEAFCKNIEHNLKTPVFLNKYSKLSLAAPQIKNYFCSSLIFIPKMARTQRLHLTFKKQ